MLDKARKGVCVCMPTHLAEKKTFERVENPQKYILPSWGLNPGPSDCESDALIATVLELLSRGAVGKLYISTKPASGTRQ